MTVWRKSLLLGALGGLVASTLTWGAQHFFGSHRSASSANMAEGVSYSPQLGLFLFKGKTITSEQLSPALKEQIERAAQSRAQAKRDAEIQFFKDVDKIARLHILEQRIASLTASKEKSREEAEDEVLPRDEATSEDARKLYEASDPSAPRDGFVSVRKQLVAYLNELRRREALEQWTNELRAAGEWVPLLSRPVPLPALSTLELEGLPTEGKQEPNALVFVDYLCDGCIPFLVEFAKQVASHQGHLRPVYVPFPYTRPEVSMALARGSLCAQQQGAFSSFHMAALSRGDLLDEVSVSELARSSGANMSAFKGCYRSGEGLADLLARAQGLARQFGLMQTPTLIFRGQLLEGADIFGKLQPLLEAEAAEGQLTKRGRDTKARGSSQP